MARMTNGFYELSIQQKCVNVNATHCQLSIHISYGDGLWNGWTPLEGWTGGNDKTYIILY